MERTIRIIFFLIVGLVLGFFFVIFIRGRLPQPKIMLTSEQEDVFEKARPPLSQSQDQYLSLLDQKAVSGGPPKDGIPAIDRPQYDSVAEADQWLLPDDVVFGLDYQGLVAAYPQRILVWHEIVNIEVKGEKLSVTYCPLTGTTIGFKDEILPGVAATFGVSGKLVNSNLIMYDRLSDSYWPQVIGQAINGPARGLQLQELPVIWTTWDKWEKKHPNTLVLSRDTGFVRNYDRGGDPYGSYLDSDQGYYTSRQVLFRPIFQDQRLHPKAVVVGVRDQEGNAVAVVKDVLRRQKNLEAGLGLKTLRFEYDSDLDFYRVLVKETGQPINAFDAMWFAWVAFYPKTSLIQ